MPETVDSPDVKLDELKKQLQESDDDLGELTKKREALKTEVETLSKTVEEIKKTTADFGQGEATLKSGKQEFKTYNQTKTQMVEAALGEKKEQVEAEIKKVDEQIETLRKKAAELREAAVKAELEYETAKRTLQEKQHAADSLKDLRKQLSENLQKLKDFKIAIERFDEQAKPAGMYVYLLEFEKVLNYTEIPSQADYEKALNAAAAALDAAKAGVASKRLAAETARAQLAEAEEALRTLEKNRIKEILKEVDKLN